MSAPTRDARTVNGAKESRRHRLPWSAVSVLAAFVVLLGLPAGSTAQPVTVDFSVGPTGSVGPTYTDPGTGLEALGMWCNGDQSTCTSSDGVWNPANLWRRNDNNGVDLGFGVCDPNEGTLCDTGTVGKAPGEFSELSDNVAPELIYLTLPPGYQWVSVTLASLDDNSNDGDGGPERGTLWADVDTTPNNGNAIFVTNYGGVGNGSPVTINIPPALASSPQLFFEAIDFTGSGDTNNDQLVYTVTLMNMNPTTTSSTTSSTTTTAPPTTASSTTSSTTTTAPPTTTTSTTSSSTTTTIAPPNCVIGLSSMEGNINIKPDDWVSGGYNFVLRGSHPAATEMVSAEVDIPVTCSNGQPGGTIRIPLGAPASCPNGVCSPGTVTYTVPANNTNRFPTADANSVLSWEGAVRAPDLCHGGPMNAAKGASFSATVATSPSSAGAAQFQFKYRDPNAKGKGNVDCADPNWSPASQRNDAATCGASWSPTVVCPNR